MSLAGDWAVNFQKAMAGAAVAAKEDGTVRLIVHAWEAIVDLDERLKRIEQQLEKR